MISISWSEFNVIMEIFDQNEFCSVNENVENSFKYNAYTLK